jgi:hypothetical protein
MNGFIINFAFQNWSDQYQWWIPNNCPADFMMDGVRQLPPSHDWMWFDHGAVPAMRANGNLDYFSLPAYKNENLNDYRNIRFQHLNQLSNSKYIYPIFLRTWDYFVKMADHGFKFIDPRVIDDVIGKRAKIVFIHPWEGPCGSPDWAIIDRWCRSLNFRKDDVYVIHGNFNLPDDKYMFSYRPISDFQMKWSIYRTPIDYRPTDNANLFLCYNRARRKHRTLAVCELMNNNLFDRGITSYHNLSKNTSDLARSYGRDDLVDAGAKIDALLPLHLEYDLETHNPVDKLTDDHHRQTFLSLVTETLTEDEVKFRGGYVGADSPVFFSEKTWKPISIGQPFIMVSTKGHLAKLKEMGYQTFDRWWSEDYDTIGNTHIKLKKIMDVLNMLSKLRVDELKAMRDQMQHVLIHNQIVYNQYRDSYNDLPSEPLYKIIQDIWSSF